MALVVAREGKQPTSLFGNLPGGSQLTLWTTDNCDNGLKGRICEFGFSNNPRSSFEQRKPDIMVNTFGGPNSLFEHWNCSKHCWEWACARFRNLQVGSEHLIWMRSDIREDSLLLLDVLRTMTKKIALLLSSPTDNKSLLKRSSNLLFLCSTRNFV